MSNPKRSKTPPEEDLGNTQAVKPLLSVVGILLELEMAPGGALGLPTAHCTYSC